MKAPVGLKLNCLYKYLFYLFIINTISNKLDGLTKNREGVFLLAASNLPWDLDVALLRRLEKRVIFLIFGNMFVKILVPLPDIEAKEAMLK